MMQQSDQTRIEDAYRECARLTRAAGSNFGIGILVVPKEFRRAIHAIYAFCRLCDDIVDEPQPGVDPARELEEVRRTLDEASDTKYREHTVFIALADTMERFELDHRHFVEIVEGCRMDIDTNRYESFEDLRVYCRKVAGAVGIICAKVFGNKSQDTYAFAEDLGIAFQLTNILRDVSEDYSNGRVYLPQDELRRFGVDESELGGTVVSDRFRDMMRFQIKRARRYYEIGERGLSITVQGRHCLELITRFYSRLLDKIESRDADVLARRIRLSMPEKLSIVAGTGIRSALRSIRR